MMHMPALLRGISVGLICAAPLACSSSKSNPGNPGASGGTGGISGSGGTATGGTATGGTATGGKSGGGGAGGGTAGMGGATLSARAQKGLSISPVKIDTAGLTAAEMEAVGTGSYIVNAMGDCNGCHAKQNPAGPPDFLGGGTPFPVDPTDATHVVYARNLTPDAKTGLNLTEAQFLTVLQTGKDLDVTTDESLLVMPWQILRWMTTADQKAIYAYLQHIPAVSNAVPPDNKGALKFPSYPKPTQYNAGDVTRPLPAEAGDPDGVALGRAIQPRAEPAGVASLSSADQTRFGRGSYIVNAVAQCNDCHTSPSTNPFPPQPPFTINTAAYLTGGAVFKVPPPVQSVMHMTRTMSENLIGKTNGYVTLVNQTAFEATIVSGLHQDRVGNPPLGFPMPADVFKNMTAEDLASVFVYLKNLTPITGTADAVRQPVARWCDATHMCTGAGETCNMDATLGNECIGGACTTAADCGACQTCTTGKCAAPSAAGPCIMNSF